MTDADNELARQWAADTIKWPNGPASVAAARFILATLADGPSWQAQAMSAQSINSSMDCRFAGKWAEMSGSHCPPEQPCDRCTAERKIEERDARIEALTRDMEEVIELLAARVKELRR